MARFDRLMSSESRASEYFNDKALQTMTGQSRQRFATVALKESADNALDACEAARAEPEVGIEVAEEEGMIRLSITDNGSGIPPEVVRRILDFDSRTSDKSIYRSPTRGAQGNALKTVVGIPHALGSDDPVVIEARGVVHEIKPRVYPGGEVKIDHDETPTPDTGGTRVALTIPTEDQDFDPCRWARAFALFNPHAFIRICLSDSVRYRANWAGSEPSKIYKPSSSGLKKYRPTDPTSAHWYTPQALKRLIFSHVADANKGGRDLPLGEFIRQFKGLTSPAKAKTVREAIPDIHHLSDFERCPDAVHELLSAMKSESKPPSHESWDKIGEDHMRTILEDAYEVEDFVYRSVKGHFPSGLPFTFEFAVATTDEPGDLFMGVNYSPTFGDPLLDALLTGPKFTQQGIKGFLREGHAEPGGWDHYAPSETAAVAHLITPAPLFLDMGKTRLQIEED